MMETSLPFQVPRYHYTLSEMYYQFFSEHIRIWAVEIGVMDFCQMQFKGMTSI